MAHQNNFSRRRWMQFAGGAVAGTWWAHHAALGFGQPPALEPANQEPSGLNATPSGDQVPASGSEENSPPAPSSSGEPVLSTDVAPKYQEPQTVLWRFGVSVEPGRAQCEGVYATFTVPKDWPEQKVKIVDTAVSSFVTMHDTRDLNGMATQHILRMGRVPAGATAQMVVTAEVEKYKIHSQVPADSLVVPAKPDKDVKNYLSSSPYIDPRHSRIKRAITELTAEASTTDGWKLVEQIYDWVREKVAYREGTIKTAVQALEDGQGDCEELTSLFVAMCRAARVPARMVWVPGHCYPEFYLEDSAGKGYWFPCQAAGNREFGTMDEKRPILQKGDRFKVPEHKDVQRYVAEFCKIDAVRGTGKPNVSFIQEKAA